MNIRSKKLIIIIVCSVLALVLITTGAIFSVKYIKNHVGNTVIAFENKTALAGDTVKISFSVNKNHGMWGGQIKINYNPDAISFISCANGDVFDECEVNSVDGSVNIIVNQSNLNNNKSNGIVASLNFSIKESAKDGDYTIEFDPITNFCDKDGQLLEPTLENGVITVK